MFVCWLVDGGVLLFVGWGWWWFLSLLVDVGWFDVLLVVCYDLCMVVGITRCFCLVGLLVGLVGACLVVVGWFFGFIFIVGCCVGFGVSCLLVVVFVDCCCGLSLLLVALFVVFLYVLCLLCYYWLVYCLLVGFVFCFGWCHWFGCVVWFGVLVVGFRFGCVNVIVVFCLLRYVWLFVL